MKVIVSFSGGKDSQACLIHACEVFGADNIEAVFCDTGWEHEVTYRHVTDTCVMLGVKLVVIRNKIGGFENLCKRMKWFPDTAHRMCTVQLKIQPMIDYILEQTEDVLLIQGIRAAESKSRSKMPCQADYFEAYKNGGKSLYRKKAVLEWCKLHKCTVDRPMLGMSAQEIIDFILQHGQQPNDLYKRGCNRVGCFPCIYSRMKEVKIVCQDNAYVERLLNLEDEVNKLRQEGENFKPASFFPKGKIPAPFCKKYGNGIPAFSDVVQYVKRDDVQLELFDDGENQSCMSIYHGLCE